jgi:hypothetical protein
LDDRFASPRQRARQAFSNQTNGAVPVTPQPYGNDSVGFDVKSRRLSPVT